MEPPRSKRGIFPGGRRGREIVDLDGAGLKGKKHIDVFVDKLAVDPEERERLVDSLEAALKKGDGKVTVQTGRGRGLVFSERLECKAAESFSRNPSPTSFLSTARMAPAPRATGSATWP